jgi:hypothetical protein
MTDMNSKFCLAATGRLAAVGLVAIGVGGALAGCSGRSVLGSNQVVVRVEDNRDIAGATAVAQETCARRGGRARLVAVVNQDIGGPQRSFERRPPDAVFECDPAR